MAYWEDRLARAQNKITDKNLKQIEAQLKKYYRSAMKRSIDEFIAVYNKVLEAQKDGTEVTPAWLYQLDKYWHLQEQIKRELNKLGDKQINAIAKSFEQNFFDVYYSINVEGMKAFNTLDTVIVQQLINQIWVADGKNWSKRIWGNTELLAQTLNDELVNCVVAGKKTTDLKKLLQERFNVSYNNAEMLVRTEMAHIQSQAAKQRYSDYGITKMEVWAAKDERMCKVCGKLHGTVFPVTAPSPVPAHPFAGAHYCQFWTKRNKCAKKINK